MKAIVTTITLAFVAVSMADSLVASDVATVKPAGPRSGASGKTFLNAEGSDNNANASFGVVEFTPAAIGAGLTLTGITLSLTESNAAFSAPGMIDVLLVTDTATSIQPANTALKFDASVPGGYITQLGAPTLLGKINFTTTGNVNSGQIDNASLTGAGIATLIGDVQTGTKFRLVLAGETAGTAGTFAGIGNNLPSSAPVLTYRTTAVPEPSSFLAIGAGMVGLLGLRRRRA